MTTLETRPSRAALGGEVAEHPLPVDAPLTEKPHGGKRHPELSTSAGRGPRWWHLRSRRRDRGNLGAASVVHHDEALRMLHLVVRTRGYAVKLTFFIAVVSFVLSFTSIQELAAESAWAGWKSYLWPLILDGLIILATLVIVALAPYRDQFWKRAFVWLVLVTAALVSIACNAFHAWLATEHLPVWMRWGSAGLACAPPIALLATTHILAILWRFSPAPPPDEVSQAQQRAGDVAAELSEQRAGKWVAAAVKIHELGLCTGQSTGTLATVLGYLYDQRPPMSLRTIVKQPDVHLQHHSEVSKIRDGAKAALGVAAPGHEV